MDSQVTEKKKVGAGVGVMIMRDEKVLLGKRNPDHKKAGSNLCGEGTWTMPGGSIEYGESFEEAGIREVFEETGLRLEKIKVICINNDKNEHAHFVTVGLFSDEFEEEPSATAPDEITEWKWFDLDNLPTPLYFPSVKILENYKQGKFYIA